MSGFRMKGSTRRTAMLSAFGVIIGGDHNDWRYAFLRFTVGTRDSLRIVLAATPPFWPFPQELTLGKFDFRHLEGVPGERAPRVNTLPLIDGAIRAHKAQSQGEPARIPAGVVPRLPKPIKLTAPQAALLLAMREGAELKVCRQSNSVLLVRQSGAASQVPRRTIVALARSCHIRATGRTDQHLNQLYELTENPA